MSLATLDGAGVPRNAAAGLSPRFDPDELTFELHRFDGETRPGRRSTRASARRE